jgi:hypothetical protein
VDFKDEGKPEISEENSRRGEKNEKQTQFTHASAAIEGEIHVNLVTFQNGCQIIIVDVSFITRPYHQDREVTLVS